MSKTKIFLAIQISIIYLVISAFIILKDSNYNRIPVTSASHETLNPNINNTIDFTKPVTATPTPTPTTPTTPAVKASGWTSIQVSQHNTSTSCWSIVNGKVYDLTSWIGQHPGGAGAIESMCGIDASSMYNDQHGNQRRPANELSGFLIGNLI